LKGKNCFEGEDAKEKTDCLQIDIQKKKKEAFFRFGKDTPKP